MPFDPSLPAPHSPLECQVIRDQLQALFNLIHSLVTVTVAQVDSTSTLPPGDAASVSVNVSEGTLRFSFGLPQGQAGPQGPVGPQGPPFATALVDGVTTLDPGLQATVGLAFDGSGVRFAFGIPRGSVGNPGAAGSDGAQGPPGEVSAAQLNNAFASTSNNSNGVSALSQTADGSYNASQMQDVLNKMDELIHALRR